MNNLDNVPFIRQAVSKVKSFFNPQQVNDHMTRSLLVGTLATVVLGELSAFKIIEQDVMAGELHNLTIDFVIISLSLLEVLVGPFVSWFGYNDRRTAILFWNVGLAAVSLIWLTMPNFTKIVESEYCHGNNIILENITTSTQAIVRLCLVIVTCIVFCLTRVAVWSHGIAYIEEHVPARNNIHFGILVAFRIVGLIVFNKIMPSNQSITMQVFAIAGSTIGNIVQVFLFMPKNLALPEEDPETPWTQRGFIPSAVRVFKNTLAVSQMVAIGLLAAALWGFAYHNTEIVKVKYHLNIVSRNGFIEHLKYILQYLVVAISVSYVGVKFSALSLPEVCRFRGIKQATFMSVFVVIFYILLTTIGWCETGHVAGLERNHYIPPECGLACGCIPRWHEFSPVCIVDQVTTYLSPCHAGCSSSDSLLNIRAFSNCTCALDNGRAALGACSLNSCSQAYELHNALFIMVVLTTVLAFQAQGMLLLRAVDPRDRSLALGFAGSIVSSLTFFCGHLIYLGISAANCRWFEMGRCHLYNYWFPIYIGSTSAVMAFVSLCISISTLVVLKLAQRRRKHNEELVENEEQILMQG